jgi:hypothetical protein
MFDIDVNDELDNLELGFSHYPKHRHQGQGVADWQPNKYHFSIGSKATNTSPWMSETQKYQTS